MINTHQEQQEPPSAGRQKISLSDWLIRLPTPQQDPDQQQLPPRCKVKVYKSTSILSYFRVKVKAIQGHEDDPGKPLKELTVAQEQSGKIVQIMSLPLCDNLQVQEPLPSPQAIASRCAKVDEEVLCSNRLSTPTLQLRPTPICPSEPPGPQQGFVSYSPALPSQTSRKLNFTRSLDHE